MPIDYIVNKSHSVALNGNVILNNEQILRAIQFANNALRHLDEQTRNFDINIFDSLGMRNLSSFVGEYFVKSIERNSNNKLTKNLHQDGYPDLLLVDTKDKHDYFNSLYVVNNGRKYPLSKEYFSPFRFGGIEVKATCGSTPPASKQAKPLIGEQRIESVNSFDWKAHHRETNNLLAVLWDFIDNVPTIAACFYRNDLSTSDWGNIVQPKEGGGRTTSVSIMNSGGVKKMCSGWVAVINDEKYISLLSQSKWIGYFVR